MWSCKDQLNFPYNIRNHSIQTNEDLPLVREGIIVLVSYLKFMNFRLFIGLKVSYRQAGFSNKKISRRMVLQNKIILGKRNFRETLPSYNIFLSIHFPHSIMDIKVIYLINYKFLPWANIVVAYYSEDRPLWLYTVKK